MSAKYKIFCIGLPKTGTTSINEALKILGYKSFHAELCVLKKVLVGDFNFDFEWDALTHSVERFYPYLDDRYPESKFILTIRDFQPWKRSMVGQLERKDPSKSKWNMFRRIYSLGLYKCKNGDVLYSIYKTHENAVKQYMCGSSRFLVVDINNLNKWNMLCGFLNKEIPNVPFPHLNKNEIK